MAVLNWSSGGAAWSQNADGDEVTRTAGATSWTAGTAYTAEVGNPAASPITLAIKPSEFTAGANIIIGFKNAGAVSNDYTDVVWGLQVENTGSKYYYWSGGYDTFGAASEYKLVLDGSDAKYYADGALISTKAGNVSAGNKMLVAVALYPDKTGKIHTLSGGGFPTIPVVPTFSAKQSSMMIGG